MSGSSKVSGHPEAPATRPAVVDALLEGPFADGGSAWDAFLRQYSRLLLYIAARTAKNYDERMNLYTHVVAELHENDCQRLRAYSPHTGARFTTWLGVVARRLCLDYLRQRYGRAGSDGNGTRRRLQDLIAEELDPSTLADAGSPSPDAALYRDERLSHLNAVLDRLDPRDRLMLTLRFVDGRSAREIAAALNCSSQWQVYRRIQSLLDALRAELEHRGIRDGA